MGGLAAAHPRLSFPVGSPAFPGARDTLPGGKRVLRLRQCPSPTGCRHPATEKHLVPKETPTLPKETPAPPKETSAPPKETSDHPEGHYDFLPGTKLQQAWQNQSPSSRGAKPFMRSSSLEFERPVSMANNTKPAKPHLIAIRQN
jgi:hypothetical protein